MKQFSSTTGEGNDNNNTTNYYNIKSNIYINQSFKSTIRCKIGKEIDDEIQIQQHLHKLQQKLHRCPSLGIATFTIYSRSKHLKLQHQKISKFESINQTTANANVQHQSNNQYTNISTSTLRLHLRQLIEFKQIVRREILI